MQIHNFFSPSSELSKITALSIMVFALRAFSGFPSFEFEAETERRKLSAKCYSPRWPLSVAIMIDQMAFEPKWIICAQHRTKPPKFVWHFSYGPRHRLWPELGRSFLLDRVKYTMLTIFSYLPAVEKQASKQASISI
jgi:hypothetical protein